MERGLGRGEVRVFCKAGLCVGMRRVYAIRTFNYTYIQSSCLGALWGMGTGCYTWGPEVPPGWRVRTPSLQSRG